MAVKKTGISRDLLFHPGETIAEVLEDRGITQIELANSAGVSAAFVNNVISGKKDISANFAQALEYALDVPKSFWLNLQANYDAELLEFNAIRTITEEERTAREALKDVVKYLRSANRMPVGENKDESILSLRKALRVSNLVNLKAMVPAGAYQLPDTSKVDPYVMGAWIRMCQISGERRSAEVAFDPERMGNLVGEIKEVMLDTKDDVQQQLTGVLAQYGVCFSVVKNFRGAPAQGYVSRQSNGSYQMMLSLPDSFADIFWFSLFHELGHIVNGDMGKNARFADVGTDQEKEDAADAFAMNVLISEKEYQVFVEKRDYSMDAIRFFARMQKVMPYIVIGRLQKEKRLEHKAYDQYRLRYKWAE